MAMRTRNEQIREASQDILRRATIIGLMRRALDPAPIADDPREPDLKMARPGRQPLLERRASGRDVGGNLLKRGLASGQRRELARRPHFILPRNARLRRLLLSCCTNAHKKPQKRDKPNVGSKSFSLGTILGRGSAPRTPPPYANIPDKNICTV
jgi:hypothetical protein